MHLKPAISVIIIAVSQLFHLAAGQDTLLVNNEIARNRLNDSLQAANYELAGSAYAMSGDWEGMLLNYLRAMSLYKRINATDLEQKVSRILATRYFNLGIYSKSASYYEQEFSLYPDTETDSLATTAEKAALSYYYQPDDTLAVTWYNTAIHYYEKVPDETGVIRCLQKQALVYIRLGEFLLAENIYNQLIGHYSKARDLDKLASAYNNLGFLKFKEENYGSALENFLSAAENAGKKGSNDYFLTDVYSNIGVSHQNLGQQEEMLESFTTALSFAENSGRKDEEARISHLLSLVYFNKEDNYHAELYCQDCIEAAKSSSAYPVLQECYLAYSQIEEKGNDFISALDYYEKYLNIRDSLNLEKRLSEQNEIDRQAYYDDLEQRLRLDVADEEITGLEMKSLIAESARRENEMKLLLKQQELDRSEKSRLEQNLALERDRFIIAEREQQLLTLQQQQLIDSLEQERLSLKASDLEMSNKLLEQERIQQVMEIEKEKQVKRLAVGLGILMVLVAISILGGLISTRKKNQKLAESKRQIEAINADLEVKNAEVMQQKEIIEQKNQSITDSIQYASRIQAAVLPPADFLTELGFDNFILYKPKDIVSGDFYWGMTKKDKIIVAAADCTGHGVPGAFMSMLGHAFLDEIVNTSEIKDAAGILNLLRDEVINTLKQKGMVGEARDGMDISLCIINREEGMLDFAGANNPLYMVRDGNFIKCQADKMPIGIHVTDLSPFTNNRLEFKPGDYIYLFSDGYADQFGGPKGKKFMYKPFQRLLLKIHKEPLKKQQEILDKTFMDWMGKNDQVDDVLVIGMRL